MIKQRITHFKLINVTHPANMVFRKAISPEIRAFINLNQKETVKELMKMTGVSRRQIFRIRKERLGEKSFPPSIKILIWKLIFFLRKTIPLQNNVFSPLVSQIPYNWVVSTTFIQQLMLNTPKFKINLIFYSYEF